MKALKIRIQLEEPVLATRPNGGEANSATSYAYIPGGMLRGAVVRAYHDKHPGAEIGTDPQARKLFFGGDVCYLNAYITTQDDERMLPTPISWYVDKDEVGKKEMEISDFAVKVNNALSKPKRPVGEFCQLTGAKVVMSDPLRQVSVHNASDERGRKAAGISQVFRYEALAAGQIFASVIISEKLELLQEIQEILSERHFLGGSHTGGYGAVKVACKLDEADWNESKTASATDLVRITCLSDLILPARGKPMLEILAEELGLTVSAQLTDAYYQTNLVGGFNRTWGLPLPQSWAIQAGSTFCLAPKTKIDTSKLQDKGIGERRTEGFGRLAVNWQVQEKVQKKPDTSPEVNEIKLSTVSAKIADGMADRLLKAELERKLIVLLSSDLKFTELPSASQLNRVRVLAQQSLLTGETDAIQNHFETMKSAKKTWERAKVQGKPLVEWLITHSAMQETTLREDFRLGEAMPHIAGRKAKLSTELLNEFSVRLVDGLLKRAVEEKRILEGR